MLDFSLTLETDNILLRPLIADDYPFFEKLAQDKSLWLYFTVDLSVKHELYDWLDSAVNDIKNQTRLAFTIIDKVSDKPIGSTSFGNISPRDKRIEIGWTWIARDYHGRGINSQVKYLMLKYVFEVMNYERVEIKTDVLNIPARKALLRIGAREEGILRSHTLMTHDRRRDTIYYSILKSEWDEIKELNKWDK